MSLNSIKMDKDKTQPPTSSRLPTFKPPRDLTLGAGESALAAAGRLGSKPRKTFTPNIPVRNRNKGPNKDDKRETNHNRRDQNERPARGRGQRGRGRGRGAHVVDIIQTEGSVFGHGVAADLGRGRGSTSNTESESSKFIPKPKLNLQHGKDLSTDPTELQAQMESLLRDDFIEDESMQTYQDDDYPVQLPLVDTGKSFKEAGLDSVFNPKVKDEPGGVAPVEMKTKVADKFQDLTIVELLKNERKDLLFIQLPDCLPGHKDVKDSKPNTPNVKSESSQQKNIKSDPDAAPQVGDDSPYCTLRDLPEGYLGKIQTLASGKSRLLVSNHSFDVDIGTNTRFLQNLLCVSVDEEKKAADVSILGEVNHRLIVSPDWGSITADKT